MRPNIFLHVPSSDGIMRYETTMALMGAQAVHDMDVSFEFTQSTFSTYLWNKMWAKALNNRDKFTHYAIIHCDLYPKTGNWLDKLMQIMKREKAEIVAANVAIKNASGLTSTAVDTGGHYNPPRFTLKQLAKMPPTFTHPKLLVNNGLMLVDLAAPWVEKVRYNNENVIERDSNGLFVARSMSDDWFFAREANKHGARIFATSEIPVEHVGQQQYPSSGDWGLEFDDVNGRAEL